LLHFGALMGLYLFQQPDNLAIFMLALIHKPG
jgi:hypothetical protein